MHFINGEWNSIESEEETLSLVKRNVPEEIHEYMDDTVGASSVSEYLSNTNLIADMCEDYSLEKPIVVPYIPLNDYEYLIKDLFVLNS